MIVLKGGAFWPSRQITTMVKSQLSIDMPLTLNCRQTNFDRITNTLSGTMEDMKEFHRSLGNLIDQAEALPKEEFLK